MKFKIKKKVTILRLYHYFFESMLLLMTICKIDGILNLNLKCNCVLCHN